MLYITQNVIFLISLFPFLVGAPFATVVPEIGTIFNSILAGLSFHISRHHLFIESLAESLLIIMDHFHV